MPWLSRLFRRRRYDAELDEEIQFYLNQETQLRIDRGESPESARRSTRRDFGNVVLVKEATREMWGWTLVDDLLRDLRHSLRLLTRAPIFTAVAIFSLAVGIGANTAIFTVVHAVLLRPLPYPQADRLVAILQTHTGAGPVFATWPDYMHWRDRTSTLASIGGAWSAAYNLTAIDEPERLAGAAVTASLFTTLDVAPILGRTFSADANQDPGVVVLAYRLWQRRFGGAPDVIGRGVQLNGRPYTVIGVMPPGFSWPESTELWIPFVPEPGMDRGYPLLQVVGRLEPGTALAEARAELTTFAAAAASAYPATNKGRGVQVVSLLESTVGATTRSLLILAGAVACVLLIACANVAGLLTSRAVTRRHEMALRSALGASRRRLVRQLLTESLALSLAGGAIGLLLAAWAIEPLLALTTLPRAGEVSLDVWVFGVTLATSVVTGLLIGLASAVTASRTNMRDMLTIRGSGSTGWLRPSLLVVEVAAAVVLLAGAGLLMRSFYRLHHVETGFSPERVLAVRFFLPRVSYPGERRVQLYEQMIARMEALPGVETAAAIMVFPFSGSNSVVFDIPGRPPAPPGEQLTASFNAATSGYFRAMGIGLFRGRDLQQTDHAGAPFVAVVNRAMAERFFPGQDPIGQSIRILGPKPRAIVGIVQDIRQRALDGPPQAEIYVPHTQFSSGGMFLVVRSRSDEPGQLMSAVRAEIRALDRNLPIAGMRTAGEFLGDTLSSRRFSLVLLSIFAAAALVLSVVGVYGVLSFAVSQRTKEIGIRMALGASRRDVVRLMAWQGMLPVLIGLAIGLCAAMGATTVLAHMLFEIRPSDPATLLGVALVLLGAAVAAVLIPARRAARIDPLIALQ